MRAQQPKQESLLDKLGRLARSLLASMGINPAGLPPTHVSTQDAAKRAAQAAGGEQGAEVATTILQSGETGNVPTPDPNQVVIQQILRDSTIPDENTL